MTRLASYEENLNQNSPSSVKPGTYESSEGVQKLEEELLRTCEQLSLRDQSIHSLQLTLNNLNKDVEGSSAFIKEIDRLLKENSSIRAQNMELQRQQKQRQNIVFQEASQKNDPQNNQGFDSVGVGLLNLNGLSTGTPGSYSPGQHRDQ